MNTMLAQKEKFDQSHRQHLQTANVYFKKQAAQQ
jgi:hypothetical protein